MSAHRELVVWKASPPAVRARGDKGATAQTFCFTQAQFGNAMHARSVREYQKRIHRVATRSARRLLDVRA